MDLTAAPLFRQLFNDIYNLVKKKASLARKLRNLNVDSVFIKAHNVEQVKTIWQVDKEVNLHEFYYPTKILVNTRKILVSGLETFPENAKIVLQGTAGQGKSILLRYLTSSELKKAKSFPLFIELRKISDKKDLKTLIMDGLNELGLSADAEELELILATNKFVLILDAFDEIQERHVSDVVTQLESWCAKYHNLRIIISSRPNSEAQKISYMKVFNIAQLETSDFENLLSKFFAGSETKVNEVLKAIHSSDTQVSSVLKTPLLLTLLVIIYKSYNQIPQNLAEFYSKLFEILCFRHDSTKPGFNREFATELTESELSKLFDAFCFFCMKSHKNSLDRELAISLIGEAKKLTNFNDVKTDYFLKDITRVTCLMVEEGFEYHFIHKSIREFHSAHFMKEHGTEALRQSFYSHAIEHSSNYLQELSFLSSIDEFNYKKLFLIPYIKNLFDSIFFNPSTNTLDADVSKVLDLIYLNIVGNTFEESEKNDNENENENENDYIIAIKTPDAKFGKDYIFRFFDGLAGFIFKAIDGINEKYKVLELIFENSATSEKEVRERIAENENIYIESTFLLRNLNLESNFRNKVESKLSEIGLILQEAEDFVAKTEENFSSISFLD
ncbi:NACHT domain-containing protein [Alteromonas macleodii]|uniref:NACHT domain-containing protein n=1 Tax=Alteromonas macleodii TaxID=28108 RepID=UPI003654FEFD